MPERTALYRLYDADGVLLYIGITNAPAQRWAHHARKHRTTWWPSVARKEIQWLTDRNTADRMETDAINSEKPLHNRDKRRGSFFVTFNEPSEEITQGINGTTPVSVQIANILRREIGQGLYPSGSPMPPAQHFAERFPADVASVYKAYRALVTEGLISQERPRAPYYRT
ncbi:GIY-YIG nuclease family protein [Streptomyces sp. NPDC005483]|uniref:GIY-YIG nuclease family protein n=1 Tax=Streptomyces sp. NPDC005483 TaxID=3154882 RepID=UPI00339FA64F